MTNTDRLCYIGQREAVIKEWNRRKYVFKFGQAVAVPAEFATVLLKSTDFVPEAHVNRPLDEAWPDGGTLLVRRWGALGDLIAFRAACAAFLRTAEKDYRFILRMQARFAHMFVHDPIWQGIMPIGTTGQSHQYDGIVTFDQIAEQDHRGRHEHRLDLFLEAMSKRQITLTKEDWEIPVPAPATKWVETYFRQRGIHPEQRGDQKLVAVQLRGSGKMKSLPADVVFMLIGVIRDAGHQVILIEQDDRVALQHAFDDGTHYMTGRDVLHGIAMLRLVDLAVTMDSGPLWMAHVAACPTLAILGPTRAEQRITYHPLYPHGARAVALNEIIDCPSCFEAAGACAQKFTCIQNQPDWGVVIRKVVAETQEMLEGRVRVPLPVEQA